MTGIITDNLGRSSGLKIAVAAGGANTPAFEAYLGTTVTVSNTTNTKIAANTEVFDSDSAYDNSTNYRFTPQTAGKYFAYASLEVETDAANAINYAELRIHKNGTGIFHHQIDGRNTDLGYNNSLNVYGIIDMNGSSDYLEAYGSMSSDNNVKFSGDSTDIKTSFGSFKIIT